MLKLNSLKSPGVEAPSWAPYHESKSVVPILFSTRDWFQGRQFFHGPRWVQVGMVSGWFKCITFIVHCYFCYYISSTSHHQALDPGSWGLKGKVKSLSHVRLFVTPWTVAYQTSLSMGFSRQGYWSGLPFPSPGDLPDLGIEPRSPALQADALPLSHQGFKGPESSCIRFPWNLISLPFPLCLPALLSHLVSLFFDSLSSILPECFVFRGLYVLLFAWSIHN